METRVSKNNILCFLFAITASAAVSTFFHHKIHPKNSLPFNWLSWWKKTRARIEPTWLFQWNWKLFENTSGAIYKMVFVSACACACVLGADYHSYRTCSVWCVLLILCAWYEKKVKTIVLHLLSYLYHGSVERCYGSNSNINNTNKATIVLCKLAYVYVRACVRACMNVLCVSA